MIDLSLEIQPDELVSVEVRGVPQLAGCKLKARRPTFDELVKDVALSGEPFVKHRLSLIVGWEGADGEASPFVDPRDQRPIPFGKRPFELACQKFPALVSDALEAAAKAVAGIPAAPPAPAASEQPAAAGA